MYRISYHALYLFWLQGKMYQNTVVSNKLSLFCVCAVFSHSLVQLLVIPWTVACQAPLSLGNLQARVLEWVAMPSSRGSSQSKDQTQVSCIYQLIYQGSPILYNWGLIKVLSIIPRLQGKSKNSVSNLKHYLIFCWKITA